MSSFRSLRAGYLKRCALTIGSIILILAGINLICWVQFLRSLPAQSSALKTNDMKTLNKTRVVLGITRKLFRSKGIVEPRISPEILPESESASNHHDNKPVVREDLLIYVSVLFGVVFCILIIFMVGLGAFQIFRMYYPENEMIGDSGDDDDEEDEDAEEL